jgi:hypothetical protein
MVNYRHAFAVLLAAVCPYGCSSGQSSQGGPGPNEAPNPDGAVLCDMVPCVCSDGRTGTSKSCTGQSDSACDCSSCPAFQASATPAFTACGGEPFGIWLSDDKVEVDPAGFGTNCPVDVTAVKPPANHALLLDLASGGTAAFSLIPPEVDFAALKQCLGLDPLYGDCRSIQGTNGTGSCSEDMCGECQCTTMADGAGIGTTLNLSGSWTRSGTQLMVSDGISTLSASYCVEGTTMTLKNSKSGTVYHMKQGYVGGTATDCYSRAAATCVEGCSLGQCQGGAACGAATSSSSCLTIQGCTWSDTTCVGTPAPCDWTSTAPGCVVAAYGTACAGTPSDCSTLSSTACASAPGCTPMNACAGSPTCMELQSQALCEGAGCAWTECMGTVEPCEVLSAADCASHPGCYVTAADDGGAAVPFDAGPDAPALLDAGPDAPALFDAGPDASDAARE